MVEHRNTWKRQPQLLDRLTLVNNNNNCNGNQGRSSNQQKNFK